MNRKFFTFLVIVSLPLIGLWAYMDLSEEAQVAILQNGSSWVIFTLIFLIFLAVVRMFSYLHQLQQLILNQNAEEAGEEEGQAVAAPKTFLQSIMENLTDAVPVEEEDSIAIHSYDGITELDNNLPPWWKAGFYLGIVFAVIYLLRFHVFQMEPLSAEEYEIEMATAAEEVEAYLATVEDLVDETNVVAVTDASRLSNGEDIFVTNCAACHAADLGGMVGPNLVDAYWIHGGSITDVFSTIKYGVPTKGMISWKDALSASEMQDVASYVLSMQGTTPAAPKDPEGDLYVPEAEPAETEPAEEAETSEEATAAEEVVAATE